MDANILDGNAPDAGKPTGIEAMAAAEAAAKEKVAGDPSHVVVTDPRRPVGNPYDGTQSVRAGTALETEEELMARLGVPPGQAPNAEGQQPQQVAGQVPGAARQATPGSLSPDVQSRLDHLESKVVEMSEDATIGRYVRSDPYLAQKYSSSLRGGPTHPVESESVRSVEIISELGLPDHFVPNPEEFHAPGTESYRYFNALIADKAAQTVDSKLQEFQNSQESQRQAEILKERFFATGRNQGELDLLMQWIGNPANFSLDNLWSYYQQSLSQGIAAGAAAGYGGVPGGVLPAKKLTPSIAGVAGASPITALPAGLKIASDILRVGAASKNPMI